MKENVFRGRSIAVIDDLSLDERLFLFEQAKKLKDAVLSNDKKTMDSFRIKDPDFGIYEVFLEDSTRTKESFKNASKFHGVKLNILDADKSSFNKHESYADTFNNLTGYRNSIFVVRSKIEGLCRWLEINGKGYAERHGLKVPPAFVNGGDGRHEHPTQEILDEFTFLEQNNWNNSNLHLAMIGDLLHGRTVHSKADGLKVFPGAKVDLIAPEEIAMPEHYVEKMKTNGFELREFESIDEYISQKDIAKDWYFTRPQLERMGEEILRRQDELRAKITFRREHLEKVSERIRVYHPLPRHKEHPTIPVFLDNTSLNKYELQSSNGYFTRIVIMGLIAGVIGEDFNGEKLQKREFIDDFLEEVKPKGTGIKEYKEGIRPIEHGMVIDHVCRGEPKREIWEHFQRIMYVLNLYGRGYTGVDESKKEPGVFKGLISLPGREYFGETEIKKLAAVSPGCTLNMIDGMKVVRKLNLNMPPRIYGFTEASCENENCISYTDHYESVPGEFHRKGKDFVCMYCEKPHTFKQLWGKSILL